MAVNLGMFMMPLHPPEKDRTECFEEDIKQIVYADHLGFSEAWIGQHSTMAWEPIPSNDVFIANVFPRTKNIRIGPGVTLIPHHHPANVALRLAMLDHLSRGRLNCAFGQSGVSNDWSLYGVPDPKIHGLMTLEGIDLVLKLWKSSSPFELKGKFWHIKVPESQADLGIGTMLKPYQKPHPPIGVSVVKGNSMAAHMAGERGYMPLSTNLVPASTLCQHWETYCAGAAKAGLVKPNRSMWRISRSVFVGESHEEAWEQTMKGPFPDSYTYMIETLAKANMLHLCKDDPDRPDEEITAEYFLKKVCIIGDVDECIQKLRKLQKITGGFGTLLMISHDWDNEKKWRRSMHLLAKEVMPALTTERSI